MQNTADKDNSASRQFDWGPPSNKQADSIKDLLVYFLAAVFLALGVWVLLDAMPTKPAANAYEAAKNTAAKSKAAEPKPANESLKHYVQFGAFSDKASADEIFAQLKEYDFKPSMAVPDRQYEFYRIFLGPFENEQKAEAAAERLNELDFPCFVIER